MSAGADRTQPEPCPTRRLAAAAVLGALALALPAAAESPSAAPADKYKLDADRLHFAHVEDDARVRSEAENPQEYEAYNDVLLFARQFTAAELEEHADRDVTFVDLVKPVRKDFQFKLVYFEGRLKRLRRLEPTRPLAAAGVKDLYEGWMFPKNGSELMCVLTTELPPGLEPAMEYETSKPVRVAGYSFKLIRYESQETDPQDSKKHLVRRAPLLMGRSFTLLPEEDADPGRPWRTGFLPGMLAILALAVAAAVGLTVWFRRGDRAARRAVETRRGQNPFGGGPEPPAG